MMSILVRFYDYFRFYARTLSKMNKS